MVMPSEIGANLSLGGVSLAVAFKTKNRELRQTSLAAASSAIIAGITEPALYGVAIRLKRPMIASMITGFVAGGVAGLAGLIRVNPAVDPLQGGDATKLRDGGIAGAAYVYNITGAAGFSDRLQELLDKLNAPRSFDSAAQLNTSASIFTFASGSVAWLQEARMSSNAELEYRNTLFARSSEALSNATGVNLDHEMTLLLDLERSYQATARLISSIDEMLRVLIAAAG